MKKKFITITLISIAFLSFAIINSDYLSIGNNLNFDNENYALKWSSNPTNNYYKQEYLRSADKLSKFNKMILVEAIEGNLTCSDAVKAKVGELEKRKKWDFVANYQVYENKNKPTEAIVDFVVSDTMTTYEWNLYRYQLQKDNNNKTYMVLFAYCYRDSLNDNNDLKKFFDYIKSNRNKMINKLTEYNIPKIRINKK